MSTVTVKTTERKLGIFAQSDKRGVNNRLLMIENSAVRQEILWWT